MTLQNDVYELKKSMEMMVKSHVTQMQVVDNFMATGGARHLPAGITRGHAILIDATGREHVMLLEQCQHLDVCSHNTNIYMSMKPNIRF